MSKRFFKGVLPGLAVGLALTVPAEAQMMQNLLLDTKAMSMGNAVTADPVGVMSIHFNPAGLTKLEGRQLQLSVANIYLATEAEFALKEGHDCSASSSALVDICDDPVVGQTSEASAAAYLPGVGILPMNQLPILQLPTGGISINPPGSKFTFANAVYAPMAAGFYKEDDDPGRYQAKQVALQRFTYFSPSFGYKVNDEFSVGMSFLMSHQAVSVVQDARTPSILIGVLDLLQEAFGCEEGGGGSDPLAPLLVLCGGRVGPYRDVGELTLDVTESLSPSYNVGFLWEPNEYFAWGATYQSEAKTKLKGDYLMEYTDDFAGFFRGFSSSIVGAIGGAIFGLPSGRTEESGLVSLELIYPQHFQTGVKLTPWENWQFNIDAGWTDYGQWDALRFEFDRDLEFLNAAKTLAPNEVPGPRNLNLPMGYQSVWSFGYGMQYQASTRLQLRAGFEPRKSSIPDHKLNVQAPLGDVNLYSVGAGYLWDKDTVIDLSLSFMQSIEEINAGESEALNQSVDCLTCSLTSPYPDLDVKTKLIVGSLGFTFRTKF